MHTGSEPLHLTTASTSLVKKKGPLGILSRFYCGQNPSSSKLESTQRINVGLVVKVKVGNCQIPRGVGGHSIGHGRVDIVVEQSTFLVLIFPGFKTRSGGQFSSRRLKGSTYLSTVADDGSLLSQCFNSQRSGTVAVATQCRNKCDQQS